MYIGFLGSKIRTDRGQLICSKMFENLFEKDKRSTIVYAREKKVDKDFNTAIFKDHKNRPWYAHIPNRPLN